MKFQETTAGELSHGDICGMVRFTWTFPRSGVEAVVTGELRQIFHIGGLVTLNLTSREEPGEIEEFEMTPETRIGKADD